MVLYQYKTVPLVLELSEGLHHRLRLATKTTALHLLLLHLLRLQQLQPPHHLSPPITVSDQPRICTGFSMYLAKTGRLRSFRQQVLSMLIVAIIINPYFSNRRVGQAV